MLIEKIMTMENNESIDGRFLVTEIGVRPFKEKDGEYLTFVLQDKSGRIHGKIWEDADKLKTKLEDDTVLDIEGKVNLFGGKNQVVIERIKKIEKDFDLGDFLISSSSDPKKMMRELFEIMNEITDPEVKELWKYYQADTVFMKKFQNCPGGKGDVHHAYIYGLLEHTLGVLKITKFLADQYKINKSIALMGAFLHDSGKLFAYAYKVAIKMTDIGRLHGHTTMGYHTFLNVMSKFEKNEKFQELGLAIGHIILSHHGKLSQHATEEPMTREAMLVSSADSIDSEIVHVSKVLETVKDNWSRWDGLRGKMYYLKKQMPEKDEETEEKPKKISRKKSESKLFEYNEEV